ncbi:MAG: hypothetical protein GX931_03610 [Acholeplasmataceae bacterium]|jgi:hypothetical protein|nr:hypothetical protein [Acholeplasmataceae bacterium]
MINKLNKITLPIVMLITFTFSILLYITEFNKGNGVESLGILIQVALFILTSLLAYLKRYYAASIFIILFKLLFVEGQAFIEILLSDYNPNFHTVEPYFNIWAMLMFFYLPTLLINTLMKDKVSVSLIPYKKFINVSAMFIFLVLFAGPETALFAVIPTFVCLIYNLKFEPDILFLAGAIKIPFQMLSYMLDETKEITLFYGLYWTIGTVFVFYGLFLIVNQTIKVYERNKASKLSV